MRLGMGFRIGVPHPPLACLSRWYPRLISREGLLARIAPWGPVPLLNPAYPQEHTFPVGGRIFR